MPFNSSGVFVNVAGATSAATGQIIQSTVWNNIHADYSLAFNEVMGQMITTPSNRNLLWMNGGLEVWQRGAGSAASIAVAASSNLYTADRWYATTNANQDSVVSAQSGLADESQLCARVQRNSGQTGTSAMRFSFPLDTDEIFRGRGNFVSLSFRARAGANWSPASGTLSFNLFSGTGASPAKRGGTPYAGEVSVLSGTVNLTAGGAIVSTVVTGALIVPTNSTQMELQFFWTPVGTAGANDYVEIDDVQLEAHLSANDYVPTAYDRLPFSQMIAGCIRHYQKSFVYGQAPAYGATAIDTVQVQPQNTSLFRIYIQLPVELRATAALNTYSPATATSSAWFNSSSTSTSLAAAVGGETKRISVAAAASASAIGDIYTIQYTASAGI